MTDYFEVNFDGLVGPTHNYAGLAYGNLAATRHAYLVSNPKSAVTQGLQKMKLLMDLGLHQAVLPPQERPDFRFLRALGFHGTEQTMLESAARASGNILAAAWSASSMWAANAATVAPSPDTTDGRIHITPANLISQMHRSIENGFTRALFRKIFPDPDTFVHHEPLPCTLHFSDEGAANHSRLCASHARRGIELFVYGRKAADTICAPGHFPARQTEEAGEAIARLHMLEPARTLFLRQSPQAVDAGVFHNDVIFLANENTLLFHTDAFADPEAAKKLAETFRSVYNADPNLIRIDSSELSLADAVDTYLFNSQLVTLAGGKMALIAPLECAEDPKTAKLLDNIRDDPTNPIEKIFFVDIRQSMRNGGGPACLRLRVVMNRVEISKVKPEVFLDGELYDKLVRWAEKHYRDKLTQKDLIDHNLVTENRIALDELTSILNLGSIYPFQKD